MIFLLVITLVITIHELGHYLACRSLGMKVEKFCIGMGPRLFARTDRRGTEWSVRWLPIGGFIEPNQEQMKNLIPWDKAYVAAAGPAINILPTLLIFVQFDKLLTVVKHLGNAYWAAMLTIGKIFATPVIWLLGLGQTATAADPVGVPGMAGPVGIIASGSAMSPLLLFILLSFGMGLINLMPIPVLDGGRIVMAGVEALAGRDRAERIDKVGRPIGGLMLLILFVVITFSDVAKLV